MKDKDLFERRPDLWVAMDAHRRTERRWLRSKELTEDGKSKWYSKARYQVER